MEYNLDVDRWVTVELITGSTLKASQANDEGSRYRFATIPDSHYWICEDPEKPGKDGEKGALYVVLCNAGKLGCTCEHFAKYGDKCEHIYRAMELKPDDIETANQTTIGILENEGWTVIEGLFSPPAPGSKTVKAEVVAELPPIDEEPEEPPVKTPPEKKPLCVAVCQYCELGIKAATQESADTRCANHEKVCKKNPDSQKNTSPRVVTQEAAPEKKPPSEKSKTPKPPAKKKPPAAKTTPKEPDAPIDPPDDPPRRKHPTPAAVAGDVKKTPANTKSVFDNIEELIEFGVGQIFGDTGTGKTALCRELAEQAANAGKKVVYWDTEGNMTRAQRAAMKAHKNITYVLDRDWHHIKNMLSTELSKGAFKLGKCDLFILDSIGVPVLGIYGTMKQNQKGEALQGMQGLLYQLTVLAEANDTVVIVTNQPVSEMNKTKAEAADRHPFGDKAMFFTKEILKIVVAERNEYKTVCNLVAWRSRSMGRGAQIGRITVSNKGTEIQFLGE